MTDLPKDVMRSARAAAAECLAHVGSYNLMTDAVALVIMADAVARAIMAERERNEATIRRLQDSMSKQAEQHAAAIREAVMKERQNSVDEVMAYRRAVAQAGHLHVDPFEAVRAACDDIAAAILEGSSQEDAG